MEKREMKALAAERDRIRSQLATLAELEHAQRTGTTTSVGGKFDPAVREALRGRLEELQRLLS